MDMTAARMSPPQDRRERLTTGSKAARAPSSVAARFRIPAPLEHGRKKEEEMKLDKQFIVDELRKEGKDQHVQEALQKLPEKVDHNEHAAVLEKFGLDPGKLAEKAAERGLSSL